MTKIEKKHFIEKTIRDFLIFFVILAVFIGSINSKEILAIEENTGDVAVITSQNSNNPNWTDELEQRLGFAKSIFEEDSQTTLYYMVAGISGKTIATKTVTSFMTHIVYSDSDDILQKAYDIVNISFCGYPADNLLGTNLIASIWSYDEYATASIEELCYSLIALDSMPYDTLSGGKNTRQFLVNTILSKQNEDNGFGVTAYGTSSTLTTATVITALSSYSCFDNTISKKVDNALNYLISQINESGIILENGIQSCAATSKTIVALKALGKNLYEDELTVNGVTLIDGLITFQDETGAFTPTPNTAVSNYATQEAIMALMSIKKDKNIYNLNGAITSFSQHVVQEYEMTDEHKSVLSSDSNEVIDVVSPLTLEESSTSVSSIEALIEDLQNLKYIFTDSNKFKYILIVVLALILVIFIRRNRRKKV